MTDRFNAFNKNGGHHSPISNKKQNKRWNNFKKTPVGGGDSRILKQNNRWTTFEKNTQVDEDKNNFSNRNNDFNKGDEKGRFHQHGNKFHKRQKRIYKSRHTKEEFFNKMESRGSRQNGISLFDNIVSQKEKMKKKEQCVKIPPEKKMKDINEKGKKSMKTGFEKEKITDNMKQLILNQCYETESEEEGEENITIVQEKKPDTIGFL